LHDAERLSARERIDVDAFSSFIDLAGSDIAAIGSESHRRAIADAAQSLTLAVAQAAERTWERDAARAALGRAEARAAERARERDAAYTARLSQLGDERDFLARELTKACRRPWRPIKQLIAHYSLAVAAAATAPFAEEMSARFTRSADKWSPRRFEKFLAGTPLALPPTVDPQPQNVPLGNDSRIEFPAVVSPEVSVIIPAYKGLSDVEACLRSISACRSAEPTFEVVLVDDCPAEPVLDGIPDSEGLVKIA